jgi:hypothetical protein
MSGSAKLGRRAQAIAPAIHYSLPDFADEGADSFPDRPRNTLLRESKKAPRMISPAAQRVALLGPTDCTLKPIPADILRSGSFPDGNWKYWRRSL